MHTIAYLIRHGEYEQSVDREGRVLTPFPQTGLSEIGREQMGSLASAIRKKGYTLDAIYASPYQRTKESAIILQLHLDIARLVVEKKSSKPLAETPTTYLPAPPTRSRTIP